FNGIKLPPRKTDSIHCTGFVTFRINRTSEAKKGDTIYNSAAIFFDYQKPVITNKSTVTFLKKNNLVDVIDESHYLYPNPNSGSFYVGNSSGEYKLYAMNGQFLMDLNTDDKGFIILPNEVNTGTYLLLGLNGEKVIKETLILIR
ncbi:MAG TPA: T9SS type A sorting domain-containing protein, partial [Bacteroidia bacterium]